MKRRVVITGMGAVSPLGQNVADLWENVQKNVCGIGEITLYEPGVMKAKLAAEVKDWDPTVYMDKKSAKRMDRVSQFGVAAAKEAFHDSGLDAFDLDVDRAGVMVASGMGGIRTIQDEIIKGYTKENFDRMSPFFIPMIITNMTAGHIAIECGLEGICSCIVTACAGATNAMGEAFRNIRDGYHDVILAGGAEACIAEVGMGGFTSMKALADSTDPKRASIPFDKERSGFVMGEGAGVLVLEELEHALARGAKIYGEFVGYGSTCDANHITAPKEDGSGAARCMTKAMEDAGVTPDQIDYINAHGTSTPLNDAGETKAIKLALGEHAYQPLLSSSKSMLGHLLGASGAVEGIITILALQNNFAPANINYQVPDEACDLNLVINEGKEAELTYALSNSLGFGGHNASILLKKYEGEN